MILKVIQPDTGKWFFYDNISLAKTRFERVQYSASGDRPPLEKNRVYLLPKKIQVSEGNLTELTTNIMVTIVDANFKDGAALEIVVRHGDGYLLNDEGKTIEKL